MLTLLFLFYSFSIFGNRVKDGVVDLSQENFENNIFKLEGDWSFSWKTDYSDFSHSKYVRIPGFWNDKNNGGFPAFGQGSYRVKVTLPKGENKLSIRVNDVHNSYSIWANGILLHEHGKPSLIKEEYIADWSPLLLPFEIDTTELELTFVVANYGHRNGGFSSNIFIGRPEETLAKREFHYLVDLFIIGGIFLLVVFLFGMFLLWSKDDSLIYFLGFALLYALWMSFREEKAFFSVWTNIHWDTALRIEYGSMIGSILFFIIFVSRIFPAQRIKWVELLLSTINGISLVIITFSPTWFFSYLTISNIGVIASITLYFIYIFTQVFKSKAAESKFAASSLFILIVVIFLEIFSFLNIMEVNNIVLRTLSLSFILSIALIFAYRFAGAFNIVVDLKNSAEEQQKKIANKNKEILASIEYAKQLQFTILPTRIEIKKYLSKFFIYYEPKDIVSGDFYWLETKNGIIHFAAADCTGHGVPGAMVSFVCSNALTTCVMEENLSEPNKILERTRELVIERFSTSDISLNDGMDISLGAYNPVTKVLTWAGANNPIWIVNKHTLTIQEIRGNKQPIGNYVSELKPFTSHEIEMKRGDRVYLFTDGFIDQFGGQRGKKFKSQHLKNLILSIQSKPIKKHEQLLQESFEDWRGDYEQIDDVCVLGVEF